MCWGPLKNVSDAFILSSPALSRMFCSSNTDGFRNRKSVAIQFRTVQGTKL